MNEKEIIWRFDNGDLLMQNFFININNSKFISEKLNDIFSKSKNITITKNNITYYLDDNVYLNKFVKIKSLYICLDLDVPNNILEEIENQSNITLVNDAIKQAITLNKNFQIYPNFINEIKSSKKDYVKFFIEQLNNFLDKSLRIYEEERDNANNIVNYGEDVLKNKQRLFPIEEGKSLKFDIFNLTINQDLTKLNSINEFYENYNNIFKFLKCLAKTFNYLEGEDKINTKFEEGSELFF